MGGVYGHGGLEHELEIFTERRSDPRGEYVTAVVAWRGACRREPHERIGPCIGKCRKRRNFGAGTRTKIRPAACTRDLARPALSSSQ